MNDPIVVDSGKWERNQRMGLIRIPAFIALFLSLMFLVPGPHGFAKQCWGVQQAGSALTVKLPTFSVTLNGRVMENEKSQYPFIVYKDITYFPMTYYDCRFLGLESVWSPEAGLIVNKTGFRWDYKGYSAKVKNDTTYTAKIADLKIMVNDKSVNNSAEPYPLLSFRDIIYFPMTWRFGVEEFGWEYSFSSKSGLVIHTSKGGMTAENVDLPVKVLDDLGNLGAYTQTKDFYYYQGDDGYVFQAPVDEWDKGKAVFQMRADEKSGSLWEYASAETRNGEAYLFYHTGNYPYYDETAGSNHMVWLKDDGTAEEVDRGYFYRKELGDVTVRLDYSVPAQTNNLYLKTKGASEFKQIGEVDYLYGGPWNGAYDGAGNFDVYRQGDWIYLLAYKHYNAEKTDIYRDRMICRVDINTGKTEVLSDAAQWARRLWLCDGELYYGQGFSYTSLYKRPVSGGSSTLVSPYVNNDVFEMGGKVFYTGMDSFLMEEGKEDPLCPGAVVQRLTMEGEYLVAYFDDSSESPYRTLAIDQNGDVILKSVEKTLMLRIDDKNNKVSFVKLRT